MEDPRKDLVEDTLIWDIYLPICILLDKDMAYTLHGFRCLGLRLKKVNGNFILHPGAIPWPNDEGYEHDKKKWLLPHTNNIIKSLDILKNTIDLIFNKEG